jgi:hypothetical protein
MAAAGTISPIQLRALQTLFGLYARHSLEAAGADPRAARLAWASQNLGRVIASFTELCAAEAAKLIGALKRALGQEDKPPMPRARSRAIARALGTHGRKNQFIETQILAGPAEIAAVERLRERLGMGREDFESWLRSRSSPLGQRGGTGLRTMADCNRVRWALKAMLRKRARPSPQVLSEEKEKTGPGADRNRPEPLSPQEG